MKPELVDTREGEPTAPLVRRYGRRLGLKLELERLAGDLVIVAHEIQTGVRLTDLPGMGDAGYWESWSDCLMGLRTSDQNS